jgi:uncharacterized protein YlxW (UPF0749 family)
VTVSLDDAPRREGRPLVSDNPDDLVVHQQDVQAVVNALWAGGAEAMTLMGERIISTSAGALRRQHRHPARAGLRTALRRHRRG